MGRDRSPPRRNDYRRDRRDDRRDHYRSDYRDDRDSRRDYRRLSPPKDLLPRRTSNHHEGRLSRPEDDVPRRDRSRDRKRERSPDRDWNGRYRSRERLSNTRSYRDDSREPKRPRRSESIEDRRRAGNDGGGRRRGVDHRRAEEEARMREAEYEEKRKAEEDARKKADRQARLVEWKKKKEAELAGKRTPQTMSAATVINDRSANASPFHGPSPAGSTHDGLFGSTSPDPDPEEPDKPFAGKFDPKAIAKRATAAKSRLEASALGNETVGKSKLSSTAHGSSTTTGDSKMAYGNSSIGGALKSTKGASKAISAGFGMTQPTDAISPSRMGPTLDMDDDDANKKRLAKMPMSGLDKANDKVIDRQNGEGLGEYDGESDAIDEGGEGAQAAAARATAEKRAAAAATAMDDVQPTLTSNADMIMTTNAMEDEEEIDPLDAFMQGLDDGPSKKPSPRSNRLLEPEVAFSDDEGVMEAVGDEVDTVVKQKKKKKQMPTTNHNKTTYEPFRKDFYTEPVDLKDMSKEELASLRFELDDIKVQGSRVPKPVQKFAQLGLGSQTLDIIRSLGFEKPTSIQAQAIPAIMSGRDVIGVARTGSGKTVAFLLPMFRHIKDQRPLENLEGPIGLILAPTRELATQIHRECKPYLKALNLRSVCAGGGAPITDQIAALKRGAEIVVCTPGRLIELLSANSGRVINLKRVTYVVVDEADRMFDMGFEPQVSKVLANIRPDRQVVLFSATFPRKMEQLARQELRGPVQITAGGRSIVPKEITQKVDVVTEQDKLRRLLQLVGEETSIDEDRLILVFVERQETADLLYAKLQRVGYPCVSVHGGKEQMDRDESLRDFKAGNVPVMIATSVAARGLDVKQLTLVINYDVPSHLEDYVHRAGRTGRAGNLGTAVTFITPEQERHSLDIIKAMAQSETPIPENLQKLADSFKAKLKDGTETRWGSGFGGKGLDKLEQAHNDENARLKRAWRREGQQESDSEEEDAEPKHEDDIKVMAKGKSASMPASASAPTKSTSFIDPEGDIKVERYVNPFALGPNASSADRAAAAAAAINARLSGAGTTRAGASIDNRGPDAGEFHYKLEINEFPQKARWAVTNRSNVAKILESTGVSITTKGRHYPEGQEPGPDDFPKMNVLVEGDTEPQVITAVRELRRLINEAVAATSELEGRAPTSGRYSVL